MVMKRKRGMSGNTIFWIVLAILIIIPIFQHTQFRFPCSISPSEISKAAESNLRGVAYSGIVKVKEFYFGCSIVSGAFGGILYFIRDTLGFEQDIFDFVFDLFSVGFLTGLWIWIMSFLMTLEGLLQNVPFIGVFYKNYPYKRTWLYTIGGRFWKIFIVAISYAVVMQIPFLNRFIDIITFTFLNYSSWWFTIVVRSLLLALYIGLLPTIWYEYKRYRLKKAYQAAVLRKKYEAKAVGQWFKN